MTYARDDEDTVRLTGELGEQEYAFLLKRVDHADFALLRTSFRWVQERPFSR